MIKIGLLEFASAIKGGSVGSPSICMLTLGGRPTFVLFAQAHSIAFVAVTARQTPRIWRKMETLLSDLIDLVPSMSQTSLQLYPTLESSPLAPHARDLFDDCSTED